jgi:aminoglycoside phosphotransferase (APT) family kinase protein
MPSPQPKYFDIPASILRVDDLTLLKRGTPDAILREVEAIAFVNQYTSIPTPQIVEQGTDTINGAYFKMNRVEGETLRSAWSRTDLAQQESIIRELQEYITQLRSLQQPDPGWIGSCSNGAALDQRVNDGFPFGPLSNERVFNDLLLSRFETYASPDSVQLYRSQLSENHNIVFTHGDLSGDNILVDPVYGRITAILDWETAGWMPEYWEYRKARYGRNDKKWWVDIVHSIMDPYEREWKVDSDLEWC